MTKVTINLPEKTEFESRGEHFEFIWANIDSDKLGEFVVAAVEAGIRKAGVDAASAAAKYGEDNEMSVEEATNVLIDKRLSVWYKGDWASTTRGMGGGMTAVDRECMKLIRPHVKAAFPKEYAAKGKDPKEQNRIRNEMLRKAWDAQSDEKKAEIRKTAQAEIDKRAAQKHPTIDIAL